MLKRKRDQNREGEESVSDEEERKQEKTTTFNNNDNDNNNNTTNFMFNEESNLNDDSPPPATTKPNACGSYITAVVMPQVQCGQIGGGQHTQHPCPQSMTCQDERSSDKEKRENKVERPPSSKATSGHDAVAPNPGAARPGAEASALSRRDMSEVSRLTGLGREIDDKEIKLGPQLGKGQYGTVYKVFMHPPPSPTKTT